MIIETFRNIFIVLILQFSIDLVNIIFCIYFNGSGFVGDHFLYIFGGTDEAVIHVPD